MKTIQAIHKPQGTHMVGDGFKVASMIPREWQTDASPLLMFDYNEPWQVLPSKNPRGVDVHPHKGFETVTIAWAGSVAHQDSAGGKGIIEPGDVQWMTAGSGILHKEFHEEGFCKSGGEFHMAQLWVNLPAKDKLTPPKYQAIKANTIPSLALDDAGSVLRVISGSYQNAHGPAKTFTRINLYDVRLKPSAQWNFEMPEGDSLTICVLQGHVLLNDQQFRAPSSVRLSTQGKGVFIESNNDAHLLVFGGTPIAEPLVAYGPFVMNTKQEIAEAIDAYNNGTFGTIL